MPQTTSLRLVGSSMTPVTPAREVDREVDHVEARGDEFYCLRYRVWYPSADCAFRTKFRTSPGCADCEQGRFNLRRHFDDLNGARFPLPPSW